MKLVTAEKMRELEKRADASGNSYADMMERAGTLTAEALMARRPVMERRVLVLVGPGNNGGDGLVCARVLHDQGAAVQLYLWKREPRDDDVNWRLCRERHIEFLRAEQDEGLARLKAEVRRADFIVDAFLGTGVTRPIEGLLKQILQAVREAVKSVEGEPAPLVSPGNPSAQDLLRFRPVHAPFVVAVDLPSGLNPDTGALDPAALAADLTVTFALPKVGQYLFPGAGAVGELVIADIGIRRDWAQEVRLDLATPDEIGAWLPPRPRDSNKGTFGKALLACGSLGFTGAPRLAALAAGRVGAGLVTLALPHTIHAIVAASLNEATYLPLPEVNGDWSPEAAPILATQARDYAALLVGCGLGHASSTLEFVDELFRGEPAAQLPALVLDADALNALSGSEGWWKRAHFAAPPILTPHPGEMSRLTGAAIAEIQSDRVDVATQYAREWNAVVVLKGAFTVIGSPEGEAALLPFADAALATAGTGDVLAGAIVGFLAQYRAGSLKAGRADRQTALADAYRAARVGAFIHGLAGQAAGQEIGAAGVLAGDLVPRLPQAIRQLAAAR